MNGTEIREWRISQNMTQEETAFLMKIHTNTLSHIEKNNESPKGKTKEKIDVFLSMYSQKK